MSVKEYRLRVDAIDGVTDDLLCDWFKEYAGDRWLLVHHTTQTENPHYHAYYVSSRTQGNLSNFLKKKFNVKGGDYSNKSCDGSRKLEYLSYLFNTKKGNVPRLVSYQGFSPIDVKIHQETAQTIAKEFQERISKKKLTMFEVAELVSQSSGNSIDSVYDTTISVLIKNRMLTKPYMVRDIMATSINLSSHSTHKIMMRENCLKFFSQ